MTKSAHKMTKIWPKSPKAPKATAPPEASREEQQAEADNRTDVSEANHEAKEESFADGLFFPGNQHRREACDAQQHGVEDGAHDEAQPRNMAEHALRINLALSIFPLSNVSGSEQADDQADNDDA